MRQAAWTAFLRCTRTDLMWGGLRFHEKLDQREKDRIAEFKPLGGLGLAVRTTLSRKHPKLVQRYMARLQDEFVKQKRKEASRKVRSEQRLMERIMRNWAGLGVKSVFMRWRSFATKRKERRRKTEARKRRIQKCVILCLTG